MNTTTHPFPQDHISPPRLATIIGASIMSLSLLVGIVGTVWIVVVVLLYRQMRDNVINIFVASLCANDALNLLCNQTLVLLSYLAHRWVLGAFLCAFMPELNMILVAVSLWHQTLIAIHRYLVVVHNSYYVKINKTYYIFTVTLGTRVLAVLLSVALSLTLNENRDWLGMTSYSSALLRCIYDKSQGTRILIIIMLTFFLPCFVVVVCFALIWIYVRRTGIHRLTRSRRRWQREINITKMFGVVFLMFLVGYIPYGFVRLLDGGEHVSPSVYVMVTVMYAVASCSNPIIVGAMSKDMREACFEGKINTTNSIRRNSRGTCRSIRSDRPNIQS